MKKMILVLGFSCVLAHPLAQPGPRSAGVGITKVVIGTRVPAYKGASFGAVGQYEMLTGVAYGELDPKDPMNAGIVNITNAPVNARGHVEYDVDITILKPLDMSKANGRLVYDVINRGHEKGLSDLNLNHFDSVAPAQVTDPASGFWMTRGYTVVWSAWEGEDSAETSKGGLLKARFPVATRNGQPITGRSREEFTSVGRGPSFTRTLTYAAANLNQSDATLTVRQLEGDARKPLPASSWSYLDAKHVKISNAPGFDPEALYEFIYTAKDPVVEGIGFAAVRDFVLFLRTADKDSTGQPNPVHPPTPFKAVLGLGISQSGRFLKDMVYQNFHVDGSGRKVFDGMLAVVTGARKTNINMEFSQPGRYSRQHEDHVYEGAEFPFTYATTTDPISGKTDGIQATCQKAHTCPPTMELDTDTEMWTARGSLMFTDPTGKPVVIPDNVRLYMPTGVPHNNRDLGDQWTAEGVPERGICKQMRNPLEYRHYVRGLLVALDQWVTEGIAPPPSRFPNMKDGTLLTIEQAEKLWPSIPDVPFSRVISKLQLMDFTQQPPKVVGPEYPIFVAKTNADGNPIGGIEPPEVTVPIATYAGRNYRAAGFAEGDLCAINGSYIPLAVTKAQRLATHDSRLSIEERYKSQADFSAKRKIAAEKLVKERYLLAEDVPYFTTVKLPNP